MSCLLLHFNLHDVPSLRNGTLIILNGGVGWGGCWVGEGLVECELVQAKHPI